jgi:Zn-dependent protease with chaperone function
MGPITSGRLTRFLLECYFPFLALLCLVMVGAMAYLASLLDRGPLSLLLIGVIALLGLTVGQFLWAARTLGTLPPTADFLELGLTRDHAPDLYEFVAAVARQRRLPGPQEIRVNAGTVAHVSEDADGIRILVLGGLAIAAFTQEALAGVIAHELGHFAAGDTRLSRRGFKRLAIIGLLEYRFSEQPGSHLNPLVWVVRLYHLLYRLVWAIHSRHQEFAADRHEVAQVGKRAAAATLIHIMVPERLPWMRLSAIAQSAMTTNQPLDQIFAEQRRRVQTIDRSDWEDALRKELVEKTGPFDSHPCLKERLAAIGVSPRKALKLALDQTGPPARALFPDWDAIEKELTERLMLGYRLHHLEKLETAQIILGRPLTRP